MTETTYGMLNGQVTIVDTTKTNWKTLYTTLSGRSFETGEEVKIEQPIMIDDPIIATDEQLEEIIATDEQETGVEDIKPIKKSRK